MQSKIIVFLVMFTFVTAGIASAHCGTCGVGEAAAGEDGHMMENKICLCGMTLEEDKSVHIEHEGKIYHFCSKACADHFQKDPEESIKKMTEAETPEVVE